MPDNITLIYAGSDSGRDRTLNTLIMKCDKYARNILKQLSEKGEASSGDLTIRLDRIANVI